MGCMGVCFGVLVRVFKLMQINTHTPEMPNANWNEPVTTGNSIGQKECVFFHYNIRGGCGSAFWQAFVSKSIDI